MQLSFAKLKVFKDNELLSDNKSDRRSKNAVINCKKEQKDSFLVEQQSKRDGTPPSSQRTPEKNLLKTAVLENVKVIYTVMQRQNEITEMFQYSQEI